MNLEQFRIFLARYANNKASREEQHLYDDFFESYEQADAPSVMPEDQDALKRRIFSRVEQQIAKRRNRIPLPVLARVAAVLFLLFGTGIVIYQYNTMNVLQTAYAGKGERKQVVLKDGTIVMLNADSRLTYPSAFKGDNRTVTLEGEAFFKVARNEQQPFVVHTATLQTTVLGTSFNITAYKGEPNVVTVMTGKVKVAGVKANEYVLVYPNQQVSETRDGNALLVKTVAAADYAIWDKGMIYLDGVTLSMLANRLERKYNINIHIAPALKGNTCLFNGKLSDDKLRNVLEDLHFMSKLDYSMTNDSTVVINNVSCQ